MSLRHKTACSIPLSSTIMFKKDKTLPFWVFLMVGLPLLLILLAGLIDMWRQLPPKHDAKIDYIRSNELNYWDTKAKLVDQTQHYILESAPMSGLMAYELVDLCLDYKVSISFALAQGKLESHFGTKGLASKTNSVWNLGAYDMLEYQGISSKYRYNHPNASIEPYLKCLTKNYLKDRTEEDLLVEFVNFKGQRYATSPKYEESLRIIRTDVQNKTQIDSLEAMVHYYAIRCNRE